MAPTSPPAPAAPASRLDAAYSPSRLVPGFRAILAEGRRRSDVAKATLACELDVRYGDAEGERLHCFPARRPDSPLVVYVHGGHWQELSIDDSCFAAPGLVERGAGFVAIGYRLAPAGTLDAMVASVATALAWTVANAARLRTTPARIHAVGSSAGAHLLAMALSRAPAVASPRLAGIALLSGVYELSGVRGSYVNAALGLDDAGARRNSPIRFLPLRADAVLVARGETETAEYARQHDLLVAALRDAAPDATTVRSLTCAGRNHFDLPMGIGDPGDELGRALLDQVGLGAAA